MEGDNETLFDGDFDDINPSRSPPGLVSDEGVGKQPSSSNSKAQKPDKKKKKKKLLPINLNIKTKASAGGYQSSSIDRTGFGGCKYSLNLQPQPLASPQFTPDAPSIAAQPRARAKIPSLYDARESTWSGFLGIYERIRGGVVAGLDYFGVVTSTRYAYEPVNMNEGGFRGRGLGGGGLGTRGGVGHLRACCTIQ